MQWQTLQGASPRKGKEGKEEGKEASLWMTAGERGGSQKGWR